jgi:UV DNA damage endonuclease
MKITDKEKYRYPKIRLGLCCSIMTLKFKKNVYSSRRLNLSTIKNKGLKWAENVAKENLIDLLKMAFWSKNHGIDVMRISSELVPHGNNIDIENHFGKKGKEYTSLNFLKPYLEMIGHVAKLEKIRLTFHPGQYVQVGSPDKKIFNASVRELSMHSTFLDMMGMPKESVIVIHIGGVYGNKKESTKRFIERFNSMPEFIKNRIVLENDEKCYDVDDVLYICKKVKRPLVFDYHHYVCHKKYHPEKNQVPLNQILPQILKTWGNIRPKFHLSEQMKDKPVGSHSFFVEEIPEVLLDIPYKYGVDIDIMIEAKGKEIAISKLYNKYPELKPLYVKDLPKRVDKKALKNLKIPEEIKDEIDCECNLN